jgi:hypothetical protein
LKKKQLLFSIGKNSFCCTGSKTHESTWEARIFSGLRIQILIRFRMRNRIRIWIKNRYRYVDPRPKNPWDLQHRYFLR